MDHFSSTKGILIHQLPNSFQADAMSLFQKKLVITAKHNEMGLWIYFKHYEQAYEAILSKSLIVRGTTYFVYPLVTNLTVQAIRLNANESTIINHFRSYGTVINLYPVQSVTQTGYKTVSLTDDYRVILDVPEVLANFRLSPLCVPGSVREFQVMFFCRLCRQNGHKQHQCMGTVGIGSSESMQYLKRQLSNVSEESESSDFKSNGVEDNPYSHNCSKFNLNEISINAGLQPFIQHRGRVLESLINNYNPKFGQPLHSLRYPLPNTSENFEISGCQNNNFVGTCNNSKQKMSKISNISGALLPNTKLKEVKFCMGSRNPNVTKSMRSFKYRPSNLADPSCCSDYSNGQIHVDFDNPLYSQPNSKTKDLSEKSNLSRLNKSSEVKLELESTNVSRTLTKSMQYFRRPSSTASEHSDASESPDCLIKVGHYKNDRFKVPLNEMTTNSYPLHLNKQQDKQLEANINSNTQNISHSVFHLNNQPIAFEKNLKASKSGIFPHESTYNREPFRREESSAGTHDDSKCQMRQGDLYPKGYGKTFPKNGEIVPETSQTSGKRRETGNGGKRRIAHRLPLLPPPGCRTQDVLQWLKGATLYRARDLPPEVEHGLRLLWDCNKSRHEADLEKKGKKLLRFIRFILDKSEKERNRKAREKGSEEEKEIHQPSGMRGKEPTPKKTRRKPTSISPGIAEAASQATGVLKPQLLVHFLIQVRGRRNLVEVLKHFTEQRDALADQLENVIRIYYRSGKKGVDEERDVHWMNGLGRRLRSRETHGPTRSQKATSTHEENGKSQNSSSLSSGIVKAVSNVHGELSPQLLLNFLKQVRGRKNILEVVKHFTSSIDALIRQLSDVRSACLRSEPRESNCMKDIHRIEHLCERLRTAGGGRRFQVNHEHLKKEDSAYSGEKNAGSRAVKTTATIERFSPLHIKAEPRDEHFESIHIKMEPIDFD